MQNEEFRKRAAILDWQHELEQQQTRLPMLEGAEKKECEARIAECKDWINKIKNM